MPDPLNPDPTPDPTPEPSPDGQHTVEDLGRGVKAKHPGQYDDLEDADVGRAYKTKYPGAYDDFAEVSPAQKTPTPPPVDTPAPKGFAQTAWEYSGIPGAIEIGKGAVKGLNSTVYHTGDMLAKAVGLPSFIDNPSIKAAIEPTNPQQEFGKGSEQAAEYLAPSGLVGKAGKLVDAATKLPLARVLGRAILEGLSASTVTGAQTGGDPKAMRDTGLAAGGTSAAVGAAQAIPGVASSVMDSMFPNRNNPVVEKALQSVESTVPMSVGQRSGTEGLQRVEQNLPGSQDFYNTQQEALAQKGQQLMGTPGAANAYGAGQDLTQNRLPDRITKLKGQADNLYDQVRQAAAANQQTVQTGVQNSPILTTGGTPFTTPVMQTFESPVDLKPIRTALTPVYQDLMRAMPEAKRAASPAFTALNDLMTSTDTQMNAMDFDKSLSAIKALARDGSSPYLTNKSQAIAKQIIGQGEQQLNQALAQAGPDVNKKLASARNMVKAYYGTADMLGDLSDEPGAVYKNLVSGGDRVVDTLKQLKKVAPDQIQAIGQTYLQGLLDKATAEGGFGRSQGILADWNRMGPETKKILFGKSTDDLDNFLLAAKQLTKNANPSGTAKMAAALGAYGAAGTALFEALTGHPAASAAIATGLAASKGAAQLLFNPQLLKSASASLIQAARPSVAPTLAGAGARIAEMMQPPPPPMPPGMMPSPGSRQ